MTTKTKQKTEEQEPLSGKALVRDTARKMLEKAKGDPVEASKLMVAEVWRSRAVRDALVEPLINDACGDVVRRILQSHRSAVWNPDSSHASEERLIYRAYGNLKGLMSFPIPGGPPLSEGDREQLFAGADYYGTQGRDMLVKESFLRLVGQSLPQGKKVKDVLNEKRLRELQQEAEKNGKK